MNQIDKKVWDILCEDEKVALGLQYTLEKSSWQAGEIMAKSHYKYLEIRYRAERFVRMFTEYFVLYDEVIPYFIVGDLVVKEYFKLCIQSRMKPGEAIDKLYEDKELGIKKKDLDAKIIEHFQIWGNPDNANEFQVYNMIKDFDRWNNFRILPEPLREPSAYKRRVKNLYKRHVKMLAQIPDLSIKKIKSLTKVPHDKYRPCLYLPLINNRKPEVIKVKSNKITLELLTQISLYVFASEKIALEYITAVHKYNYTTLRECTDGLNFWPTYRECISKAKNYDQVQKITPHRKYLDMALKNLEFYNHKK